MTSSIIFLNILINSIIGTSADSTWKFQRDKTIYDLPCFRVFWVE